MVGRRQSQGITYGDAFSYIESVKKALDSEPAKYKEVLSVLIDFQAERVNADTTIAKVMELLKDHGKLFHGFRVFLPPELKGLIPPDDANTTISPMAESTILPETPKAKPIISPMAEPTILPEAKMAIPLKAKTTIRIMSLKAESTMSLKTKQTIPSEDKRIICTETELKSVKFMNKLQTRFRRLDTYKVAAYHKLMRSFKEGNKSETDLHKDVIQLLYYHDDLLDDFFEFASTRKILWREEYLSSLPNLFLTI